MVFMDEHEELAEERRIAQDGIKDIEGAITRLSEYLKHDRYIVDHPDLYDDFVVDTSRRNISRACADLEFYHVLKHKWEERYFSCFQFDKSH